MEAAHDVQAHPGLQLLSKAETLINGLTDDFQDDYCAEKLPKEVAAWLGILKEPRKLIKSGDSRMDLIVSTLYHLACSMDVVFGTIKKRHRKVEDLLKERARYAEKKDAQEEVATKARQKVQVGAFKFFRSFFYTLFRLKGTL